jgi:two-component system chemotaxis response regulator CheY
MAKAARKILVVDDDRVVLKVLAFKLGGLGYRALTARDGSEAITLMRHEMPDLILMDINFPPDVSHGGGVAWDGFLLTNWLRGVAGSRRVPVIFMTVSDPELYQKQVLAYGGDGIFQKTNAFEAVPELITAALSANAPPPGGT